MWPLTPPSRSARDVYRECISNARPDNRAILDLYEDSVAQASDTYNQACRGQELHTLNAAAFRPPYPPLTDEAAEQHADLLENVYTQRLVGENGPGRHIYNELRASAHRCPLCGVGRVTTLDHHLPKTKYQYLAVTPTNLLPACADCNKKKASTAPGTAAEQTLHPYFDNIDKDIWLTATVIEDIPCTLQFAVTPPTHWPPELIRRVEGHFLAFGLGELYALQASDELVGLNHHFIALAGQGPETLTAYLAEIADSHAAVRRNHWQTATYRALERSTWFCTGGFIPAARP
ncbi:HNH endonuclease [Streptomyces sp. NPDC057280]|uniref:HNH endonuclease n=1 Tax=Streptomyces sp. NPDC057280 TaxID=3346081 RepID=UPI003625C597